MCFINDTVNLLPSRQELTRNGLLRDNEATEVFDPWQTVEIDVQVQLKSIVLEVWDEESLTMVEVGSGQRLIVGRSAEQNDPKMSRRHFSVRCDGNCGKIRDLLSTNGTLVNGIEVDETTVYDGDRITAGATSFIVRFDFE